MRKILTFVTLSLAMLASLPGKAETVLQYGETCAKAIEALPAFNCLDGEVIPITVDGGQTPIEYKPDMDCDRPSLLPLGNDDGQCVPYSRALLLSDTTTAQITALCRQKTIRSADSPMFDEVDIVAHNPSTGDTCWFQATAKSPEGMNVTRVPPPNEKTPPPGHVAAKDFWNAPEDVAKDGCGSCHDNDPFMYSPYIAQVWHQVPTDPFGWYKNIGEDFKGWEKPKSITTRGNTCTGCHRIGTQFTCSQGILEAAGEIPPKNGNAWANSYPNSHWMPPGNFHNLDAWNVIYKDSIKQLSTCCTDPDAQGCSVTPITGNENAGS